MVNHLVRELSLGRRLLRVALVTACVLLIPLVAMQFTDEVRWRPESFAAMGALLFGTGFLYELAATKLRSKKDRLIVGLILAVGLLIVWVELAVGIFN